MAFCSCSENYVLDVCAKVMAPFWAATGFFRITFFCSSFLAGVGVVDYFLVLLAKASFILAFIFAFKSCTPDALFWAKD